MKNKTTKGLALLIALFMIVSLMLTACNGSCDQHKDIEGDGVCDVCGAELCSVHVDVDGDGVCNNCKSALCQHHKDLDSNGVCDNCGALITVCVNHKDANSDNVCDNCGVTFVCVHTDKDSDGKCDKCGATVVVESKITLTVTASKTEIELDETVSLTVSVDGTTDSGHTWSYSKQDVVVVENDTLRVVNKDLTVTTKVVVTATSTVDPNASASVSVTINVPTKDGKVGDLTADLIKQIGSKNITVSGVVTDTYIDNKQSYNSWENKYSMTVKMEENLWYGSWQTKGSETITNIYGMSDDIVKDNRGVPGNALVEYYIDKDNKVATKQIKDYNSIPTTWDNQHLWNHLGNLDVNKFSYDADLEVYEYVYDHNDIDELYFMTYLAYSLTPMLEETLDKLYLQIENGAITKLIAQTSVVTYPEDDENPDAISYTLVELSFTDIGTTKIEIPTSYTSEGATTVILQNALEAMAALGSYHFEAVETTTRAPSSEDGDYEMEYSLAMANVGATTVNGKPLSDGKSAVGKVGLQGWVTPEAVLLCRTGKYTYSMDDQLYWYEYYGYLQTDATHYDYFKNGWFTNTNGEREAAYMGQKSYTGSISDRLPGFNFAAELFTCTGVSEDPNTHVTTYTYKLLETTVCRDIAMQLGMYYAEDSEASLTSNFTITVKKDAEGKCYITSVKYPYSLTAGTYLGYVTVTFDGLGTATIPTDNDGNDIFGNYQAREIPDSWDKTTTKYYSPNCSTLTSQEVNSEVAFRDAFGDKYDSVQFPQYRAFFEAFGDDISGPFYEYDANGTDAEGNTKYKKYVCLTLRVEDYDENMKISVETYNALMAALTEQLAAYGFKYDAANTDTTGGATSYGTKYYGFINSDLGLQIKVESNGTRNFWIYIYNMGDYSLNKAN